MDNEKLFKDISLEAQAALVIVSGLSDGTMPLNKLREASQKVQNHIEHILNVCPYGEKNHGND